MEQRRGGGTQVNSWFKEPTTSPLLICCCGSKNSAKMGTGYRGVKDIVSEFREQQWSAPRGAVAFKPALNPALNKPLEGDSNQKRLLKILLEPARTHAHTHKGERMLVTISGSGCLCVTESQCGYPLLCVCVSVCVPGITTQHFYFNQLLRSG